MADDLSDLLEDMSELDKQILEGGYASKEIKPAKKSVKFNEEDDILGDLLSDSENSPKRQKSISTSKSTRVADLFGIKPQITIDVNKPIITKSSKLPDYKNAETEKSSSLKLNTETQRQNIIKSIFTESDSTAKTQSIDNNDSKKSSFNDIFNSKTRPSTGDNISSQYSAYDGGSNVVTTNKSSNSMEYLPTQKREPRRRRGSSSTVLEDPLGLFSAPNKVDSDKVDETSVLKGNIFTSLSDQEKGGKKRELQDLPDWLGGSSRTSKQEDTMERSKLSSAPALRTSSDDEKFGSIRNSQSLGNVFLNSTESQSRVIDTTSPSNLQNDQISIVATMQNDIQSTTSLFQQYEQLGNILENRKLKLMEQEKQFEELVKRQIEGQALLEAQLKMQHGRINNCLQTLLVQSSSNPGFSASTTNKNSNGETSKLDKESEAEILVKKLQIEKVQLEQTVESIKEKHEREIFILDESYRKQIQFLEESQEKLENRLKKNTEMLEEHFETIIQHMKEKMVELDKAHEDEKELLMMENKRLLQETYERHSRSIELLQREHADTIENISKTKKLEQTAIDLITTRGTDVAKILDNSEVAINNLIKLQERMEECENKFVDSKENAFKKQEIHLQCLKDELERDKNILEAERKQFIKITQKFEEEVSSMSSEFRNRMSQLMEMENNLKLRETALVRDRQLLMEQSKWELANIKASKEMWDKEQVRQAEILAKERESIATERGKLQVFNTLQMKSDEINKVELESSVKAAKEATESIVRERKMWQERIAELETQRNILLEKENQLVQQAKHLEDLTQLALIKKNEGIEALKRARQIEHKYKEKFQQLQVQLQVLDERENKIAAEKIALARERISLRMSDIQLPERDDKPIKMYNQESDNNRYFIEDHIKSPMQTHFKDIVDPKLLLLKINLNNKLTE